MVITVRKKWDGTETAEYHGTYVSREDAWKKVDRIAGETCTYTTFGMGLRFTGRFVPSSNRSTMYIPGVGFPEENKYEWDYFIIKPVI